MPLFAEDKEGPEPDDRSSCGLGIGGIQDCCAVWFSIQTYTIIKLGNLALGKSGKCYDNHDVSSTYVQDSS